jgi:hypothetical protein
MSMSNSNVSGSAAGGGEKWPDIQLDGHFSQKVDYFVEKSLRELEQFDVFFDQLA